MKKYSSLILLILTLSLTGCSIMSKSVDEVQMSTNSYYYYTNRFEEVCPSYDSAICVDYKEQAKLLQRWEKLLKEASEAVNRGGKFPLQLKALRKVEKELKDKTNDW